MYAGFSFFAFSLLVSSFYSIYDANKLSRKFQTSYMKQIVLNANRLSLEESLKTLLTLPQTLCCPFKNLAL